MVTTGVSGEVGFLFYVMFWTILAMMLVLLYSLKQVIVTQRYIQNIDTNIEKLVRKTLADEERILDDLEHRKAKKSKK
jgi:hypothetical protein